MKLINNLVLAAVVASLAGCASAPSVTNVQSNNYPTLHQAMQNTDAKAHWRGCGDAPSQSLAKECQSEFIMQSVGPAPLIAVSANAKGLPTSMQGLNDAMNAGRIALGAMTSLGGGLSSGNIALGVAGLLFGGGSPDLQGLNDFNSGGFLYAVRFASSKPDAEALVPDAAKLEASLPTLYGGNVIGHTSYGFKGITWEPHEELWRLGSGSFGIRYKAKPSSVDAPLQPTAVWMVRLSPLVEGYSVTDQWMWGDALQKDKLDKARQLSKKYPDWSFVFVLDGGQPWVCADGVCKEAKKVG